MCSDFQNKAGVYACILKQNFASESKSSFLLKYNYSHHTHNGTKLEGKKIPQLDENKIRISHDFLSTTFMPLAEKECQGTTVIIISSQIQ